VSYEDAIFCCSVCCTKHRNRGQNGHSDQQKSVFGAGTQALYDEAKKGGWSVISMKNDWNRIFAFEE
jgi:hypothetical protein